MGAGLSAEALVRVGLVLADLAALRGHLLNHPKARSRQIPLLFCFASLVTVPGDLAAALEGAFDDRGRLSEGRFPQLGVLRRRAEDLYKVTLR